MKKTITRVILMLLVFSLALGMAACSDAGNKTTGVDFSQYPAKFEDWTMADLKSYLRAAGIIVEDSWVIDVSENEIVAMGVSAGTMYVDMTAGTISDMFFYCDSTAEGMADVLKGIRDSKTILGALARHVSTPNSNFQPMNANFGIVEPLGYRVKGGKVAKNEALSARALEALARISEDCGLAKNNENNA